MAGDHVEDVKCALCCFQSPTVPVSQEEELCHGDAGQAFPYAAAKLPHIRNQLPPFIPR